MPTNRGATMGRAVKNVEFLRTFHSISGLTVAGFAAACGKQTNNMTNYLHNRSTPGTSFLQSALRHFGEGHIIAALEVQHIPDNAKLPTKPGVYMLYSSVGDILYIGQAINLRVEIGQTLRRRIPIAIRFGPKLK